MGTLRKEAKVGVTCNQLKSHLFKAFVLPTLHIRQLGKLSLKGLQEGMRIHLMSHVKVCSLTTSHILLAEFGQPPIELNALELSMGFQRLVHLPSSWLVNQGASLFQHLAEHGFDTWHKSITMWKASLGLSHWETHDNPTTSKITFDGIKGVFLAKEWNSFHFSRKKLDYLHLKNFYIHEHELYLKQPLTPPQRKTIVTYNISNHRLASDTRWWSNVSFSKDNRSRHFAFIMRHTLS